jgi:16S rRNA (cytidine1402-2'-O)-methyltransferase
LAGHYAEAGPPKGEIVILVAPPGDETVPMEAGDIDALLVLELERGSVKDAARAVAEQTGLPRRDLYNRAVALRADEKGA